MADLSTIEPVEVFAVGVHPTDDGPREYTVRDLDEIVANFARLSDKSSASPVILEPTIVLGHEEDGDEAKFWASLSTGIPSVGTVARLWRDGDKLFARLEGVIPEVQEAIRKKMYRKVSAEIYDNFEDQGKSYGLTFRRLAFLGGEIPQVKQLSDILAHVKMSEKSKQKITRVTFFSEAFCDRCNGKCGSTQTFEEASSMDRAQLLEALQAMGVDVSIITPETPDSVLEAWLKSVGGGEEQAPEGEEFAEEEMVDPNVDPNAVPPEEEQMFAEEELDPMAGVAPPAAAPEEEQMAAMMDKKKFSEILHRHVRKEVEKAVKGVKVATDRKETIRHFCERLRTEGKALPAWFDKTAGKPTLETVLNVVAARGGVVKFGEKKVDVLRTVMNFLESIPPIAKFSESVKSAGGPAVAPERINSLLAHSNVGRQILNNQK